MNAFRNKGYVNKVTVAVDITASNSKVYTTEYHCMFIGGAGDVATVCQGAQTTTVIWQNILGGSFLPVAAYKILSTSTTASNIKQCIVGP